MRASNIVELYREEGRPSFVGSLEEDYYLFIPEDIVMNQKYLSNALYVHQIRGKLLERGLETDISIKRVKFLDLQVGITYVAMKLLPLLKGDQGEHNLVDSSKTVQ